MRAFRHLPTAHPTGIVASIPHTGTWMPDAMRPRLASDAMRALPMTDWHLHALYDFLPALGIEVLHATVSRFAGDLNRSPTPLALYPGRMETAVIPLETFWGEPVWSRPPDAAETAQLVEAWHRPYHARLGELLDAAVARHGRAVLLDLHSVASRASRIHGELEYDIYLGDRDGVSCRPALIDAVDAAYRAAGLRVTRNAPYKGGYITHHYGARDDVDALQIEMVQRVYMDEGAPDGAPSQPRFADAKKRLEAIFRSIQWD